MTSEIKIDYYPKAGKQKEFHDDRYKVFARGIFAGTGAGKTLAGWYETFLWALENPGSRGYIFEPNFKMIRRILIPTFRDIFKTSPETSPLIKEYSKTESRLTWINDSETWLIGLDEPENAEGGNIDYAWADEFRLVGGSGPSAKRKQETAWRVIVRRTRGSIPGRYPTGIWITTTPGAPLSVLHQKFENPKTRLKNSKIYRWSVWDNPTLTETYIEELVNSHSGGLAERFLYGRFAQVASGSFTFDYSIHVVDAINVPGGFRRILYGVDFGWSNPSAIVAVGVDGDGRVWVLDEFYQNRVNNETLRETALELRKNYGNGLFYCDRSEPKTIMYLQRGGLRSVPDKSKRDDGIRALGGRFKIQGDNRPRIYIHERCENLIAELQVYDDSKTEYDHAVDALRYACASLMKPKGDFI